jgi:uncharacterized protein (TIGR03435 family)
MRRITTSLGVVLLGSFLVRSQEVASIKPTDPNDRRILFDGSPGQARYVASLKMLIQYAYHVRGIQLLGGPEWINSDRYTIVAKLPANESVPPVDPTIATVRETLQTLLADRFQLKIHKEIRKLPIYVLRTKSGELKAEGACPGGTGRECANRNDTSGYRMGERLAN